MRILVVLIALASMQVPARADVAVPARELIVGTKESPPFAMKADDGTWTGISIELWRNIAAQLDVHYTIRELELDQLLAAIRDGSVDVGVGALTINAARETEMDFAHPMFTTGLSIAVVPRTGGRVLSTLRSLVTWEFATVVGGLLALLAAVGALVWLAERRRNPSQFGGTPAHGIGAGLWWSAVTMTTVGYGDKAPVTLVGRSLALVWMFTAVMTFSVFTASIASALTVKHLETSVNGPEDLGRVRVGTVGGSTSADYLAARGIAFRSVANVPDGLRAVADGELDAMVYDAALLQYHAQRYDDDIVVLPNTFRPQAYGFALPQGSALRESINRVLLRELSSERFHALREHYLGH